MQHALTVTSAHASNLTDLTADQRRAILLDLHPTVWLGAMGSGHVAMRLVFNLGTDAYNHSNEWFDIPTYSPTDHAWTQIEAPAYTGALDFSAVPQDVDLTGSEDADDDVDTSPTGVVGSGQSSTTGQSQAAPGKLLTSNTEVVESR